MEEKTMSFNKVSLSDEQMDQVTGGTFVPHLVQAGETVQSIVDAYNADKPENQKISASQFAKWNKIDPNTPLTAGTTLVFKF